MKFIRTACAIAGIAVGTLSAPAFAQTYTIASNPQGTLYFTIGSAIAAVLENATGNRTIVQPYSGTSVYLPLLASGEATLALSSSLETGRAFNDPEKPVRDFNVIGRLSASPYGYFVRADSGITEVSQLKGKRVAREVRAQLALTKNNTAILTAGGLDDGDYEHVAIGNALDGVALVTDGSIDAAATIPGSPQSQQAHATIPGGIRYLNISGEKATNETMGRIAPGGMLMDVEPRRDRPSITEKVTLSGINQFIIVGENLPDEDVTKILNAIWDNWPRLQEDLPSLRDVVRDDLAQASNAAPYHPAAIAFYKEKGLWTPENDAREQAGFVHE